MNIKTILSISLFSIVSMIKELGQYEKYRGKLRNAAYEAMQKDINGDEEWAFLNILISYSSFSY